VASGVENGATSSVAGLAVKVCLRVFPRVSRYSLCGCIEI